VPGQLADVAVFSRNLLTAEPDDILTHTRCDLTIRGGTVVFERESSDR
jgi:predicted amidohydrolase YtcJ